MLKSHVSAAVLLMLCVSIDAHAQDTLSAATEKDADRSADLSARTAPSDQVGIRLTQNPGFTLLEHGVWQRAPRQASGFTPVPPLERSIPQTRPKASQARRTARPSFRRSAWLPWVTAAENRHGLPTGLLDALIWTESHYNPMALSGAGAAGLAQLMPGTAQGLGVANRYDPIASIDGGARYLRQMLDRFGLIHLAIAAYNAGPGAVDRAQGIPANGETPGYVHNVLERWELK